MTGAHFMIVILILFKSLLPRTSTCEIFTSVVIVNCIVQKLISTLASTGIQVLLRLEKLKLSSQGSVVTAASGVIPTSAVLLLRKVRNPEKEDADWRRGC